MKKADVGDLVEYRGRLMRVVGLADGRSVVLDEVNATPCPHCGERARVSLLERSPLFQEEVHAVPTLKETNP